MNAANVQSPALLPSQNPVRHGAEAKAGGQARTVSDFLRYDNTAGGKVKYPRGDRVAVLFRGRDEFTAPQRARGVTSVWQGIPPRREAGPPRRPSKKFSASRGME